MGRSLVLSFLILSVIFYTMGSPKDDTGKIDYIHSVKNHDFSTKAIEKRFFNALKPELQQNNIKTASSGLGKHTKTHDSRIVQKKDAKKTQAIFLPLPKQQALDKVTLTAAPPKKQEKSPKIFQLPSYLPFKDMIESTITLKGFEPKDNLTQNKKPSLKVARIVPQKSEDGLMDFMPLEHVYTPPKTQAPLKIIEKTATPKIIKTVALPHKPKAASRQRKVVIASLPQNPITLITLPVKRASLPKKPTISTPSKKVVVTSLTQNLATLMALPVKRATLIENKKGRRQAPAAKPSKKTVIAHLQKQKAARYQLRKKKDAAKKWRNAQKKSAHRLRIKKYALKRQRTRSLMRQLQAKLARRKSRKDRSTRIAGLPVMQTNIRSAGHARQAHMKKVMSRKNKKAFQKRMYRKKKRLASLNSSLKRKKISRRNRAVMRRKLRLQHRNARKKHRTKIAGLPVRVRVKVKGKRYSSRHARQARMRRVILHKNNRAFQNRIRKQRRSARNRSKNRRILRQIDRKLGQKRFQTRRTAAFKQKKRRRRLVKQRLRRRTVRRKTVKKYRIVRRTRVARRRAVKQPWHRFNFDGTMGGD